MLNSKLKVGLIELGGSKLSSSNTKSRESLARSSAQPNPPLPSRELIESSHRIPQTRSPTKHPLPMQPNRPIYRGENEHSFSDLDISKISNASRYNDMRPMLGDRSNKISPQKQIVKISYPSKNSSVSSRDGSQARRVVISPAKNPIISQLSPKEAELTRKLSILEARVG